MDTISDPLLAKLSISIFWTSQTRVPVVAADDPRLETDSDVVGCRRGAFSVQQLSSRRDATFPRGSGMCSTQARRDELFKAKNAGELNPHNLLSKMNLWWTMQILD